MSNVLDSFPSDISAHISCHYVNATESLQVVRIENISNWYFERVIFPGQSLVFHALPEAILEIHSCEMATAILMDRIPCGQIRCTESADLQLIQQKQGNLQAA